MANLTKVVIVPFPGMKYPTISPPAAADGKHAEWHEPSNCNSTVGLRFCSLVHGPMEIISPTLIIVVATSEYSTFEHWSQYVVRIMALTGMLWAVIAAGGGRK